MMSPEALVALDHWYFAVLLCGIVGLIWLETALNQWPFASDRARAIHAGHHLVLWSIGLFVSNVLVGDYLLQLSQRFNTIGFGPLSWLALPSATQLLIGVIVLDFGDYLFHVLAHRVPWLWRLHAVHHSDTALDVTTSLRFHPLEAAFSLTWSFLLLTVAGLPLWSLLVQPLVMVPFTLWQHMNVVFPEAFDRPLRWLLATPGMHRIHHSPLYEENNTNFGSTFSVWDRLFGTLLETSVPKELPFGLPKLQSRDWQTVWGMLKTPFSAQSVGAF